MKVTCVLFDFFGTLVDYNAERTTQNFSRTYELLRSHGAKLSIDEMRAGIECAFARWDQHTRDTGLEFLMPEVMSDVCEQAGLTPTPHRVSEMVDVYIDEWSTAITEIGGVPNLLQACHERFKVGLITNTHHPPMIEAQLNRLGIAEFFDVVVTSAEHGKPKPDPSIFLSTLETLSCRAEESIYVGDNYRADYEGAKRAGIACYLIGSHARVPRLRQLPSVLDLAQVLRRTR